MAFKKLPYGNCNFADIIESGYAYVDKTRYVELLENEANKYQFMLRPRRFGKSLFLSVLENYYDINRKDRFAPLFGNLYIGTHPTPEQGKYAVLTFDFSVVDTYSPEVFRESFLSVLRDGVCRFLSRYKNILSDTAEKIRLIGEQRPGIEVLLTAYSAAGDAGVPIFAIIDEYDNFANDLIAMNGAYENEVMKDGIVRTFYKSLKSATNSTVRRIFITGVSPMMVNDLTSGFNMAVDLSLFPKYNEMFGFTRTEVERLMDETGIDKNLITVDMESFYNGYMFDNEGNDKVYNSQMILFLFYQVLQRGKQPEQLVDANLRTGYDRLHRLTNNENNRETLLKIIMDGGVPGNIIEKFSLNESDSGEIFISLLFYLGMLTCGGTLEGETYLKIPNYSIKTLYWDYIIKYLNKQGDKTISTLKHTSVIQDMAYRGNIKPYLDLFIDEFLKRLSDRDLVNFDEKYIKVMMLSSLYMSNFYLPQSEDENVSGYSDIYLQKNPAKADMKFEYVFELKYVKTKAPQTAVEAKFAEAFEQIEKYKKDPRFAGRDDIKFAAIVFKGKGKYEVKEVN